MLGGTPGVRITHKQTACKTYASKAKVEHDGTARSAKANTKYKHLRTGELAHRAVRTR